MVLFSGSNGILQHDKHQHILVLLRGAERVAMQRGNPPVIDEMASPTRFCDVLYALPPNRLGKLAYNTALQHSTKSYGLNPNHIIDSIIDNDPNTLFTLPATTPLFFPRDTSSTLL